MIPIKNEQTNETINIAENWDEVSFQSYVDVMNIEALHLDEISKNVRVISAVSDNPNKCREWIGKMPNALFIELCGLMAFTDIKDVKSSSTEFLEVEGKKYKIIQKYQEDFTMDEIAHHETLKAKFKGTEDHLLAFGLLLREIDENGKELDFTPERFDYVVNHLPSKVKFTDMFSHVNFFLSGGERPSVKIGPAFSILKER